MLLQGIVYTRVSQGTAVFVALSSGTAFLTVLGSPTAPQKGQVDCRCCRSWGRCSGGARWAIF